MCSSDLDITTYLDLPDYLEIGANEGDCIGEISYLQDNKIIVKNNLILQKIIYESSPYSVITPTEEVVPSLTIYYVIIIVSILLLLLLLILYLRKRKLERKRRLKYKKLFK